MTNNPTRSQMRIDRILKRLNRAISAQELYTELRQANQSMGLATIYRSLEALKIQGQVQVRMLPNGEALYSSAQQQDQHHLTCVNCGTSIPIDECPVHNLETELENTHKFKVYYHTLEFFGLCSLCQLAAE
ncbi:MAG: transcriptional repressor [Gomphosphaeria aponina SAG 52.96 = DSM 107014]|uniref:Transcriptional repressor n=1 Tax=Gomphosphaeria aponina SAG 52.96 = DSM 107014 TaxID=1521640 RepID=A0A941JNK6_9CHRO|nr:transcriptional repressor [Gomphosphaeria aponina SAG 52.96 = DSM 107014]